MAPPMQRSTGGVIDAFESQAGTMVNGRYRLESEAGRGNFARVLRARDTKTNQMVAVKILRQAYARDAKFESDVLQAIARKDPHDRQRVCKARESFTWGGCPCFVFSLFGPSLKSRQHHFGVPNRCARDDVRLLAKQLARTLQFLHFECRMVHTDLKPENILVTRPDKPQGVGDGWTVVDFGSASFYSERPDKDLISTRPYRAPEVLVQSGWSYAADMWSFACILYEVYRGKLLFSTSQDHPHLQQMEWRLGAVPQWLVEQALPQPRRMFDSAGRLRASTTHPGPRPASLAVELGHDEEFCDLMLRLLDYDPAVRLRADEVCHHPFCAGVPGPPGTETPPLTRLPVSAYSSQRIRSPGCALLAAGAPRARPDKLLFSNQNGIAVAREAAERRQAPAPRGASATQSVDPAAGQRRDVTPAHPAADQSRPMLPYGTLPSSSSSAASSSGTSCGASSRGSSALDRWPSARQTAPRRPVVASPLLAPMPAWEATDKRVSPVAPTSADSLSALLAQQHDRRSGSDSVPVHQRSVSPSRLPVHMPGGLPAYRPAAAPSFSRHGDSAGRLGSWREELQHRRQL
eukprot:TRINITY_DN1457_c0_g2_i1.p1 TRINITY_DN1457_c0_g2~~TRINITY_DN1457_c0_g2_i1.p1  ORF type:complete len:609 (+),score=124.17 TRINITY_DN1457_c0_g2_i1:101-1828(+)